MERTISFAINSQGHEFIGITTRDSKTGIPITTVYSPAYFMGHDQYISGLFEKIRVKFDLSDINAAREIFVNSSNGITIDF